MDRIKKLYLMLVALCVAVLALPDKLAKTVGLTLLGAVTLLPLGLQAQVAETIPANVTTAFTNAGVVIGLIGAAVLLVVISIMAFKWFQAVSI